MQDQAAPAGQDHPYFPPDAVIPGYEPNGTPIPIILAAFGGILGAFVLGSVGAATRYTPSLKKAEQLTIAWFSLCGFLHCFFEGYFVLNHATLPSSQSLFAQLWKEYALSDSRYLTSDPFMLCIETLTTLTLGPLCFLTALLTAARSSNDARGSTRHLLQALVSGAHLYGVALYYGTCGLAQRLRGVSYSRPEALYYWGYMVGMNAPWAVVPCVLLSRSARTIQGAFAVAAEAEKRQKGR